MTIVRMTRVVAAVGIATLTLSALAWMRFGLAAALAILAVTSALAGFAKGLIELSIRLSPSPAFPETQADRAALLATTRTSLMVPITVSLLTGVAFGYSLGPLVDWAARPAATLDIARQVEPRQLAVLHWRNLPSDREIWLLVFSKHDEAFYPQRCRPNAVRRGSMRCEVQIGGAGDSGRQFNVSVVLVDGAIGRELSQIMNHPGYFSALSSAPIVLTTQSVTRRF